MQEPIVGSKAFLNYLLMLKVLFGTGIIILIAIYYHKLSHFLGEKEQKVLFGALFHFQLLGLVTIIVCIVNYFLWNRLWDLPFLNDDIRYIINIWLLFNTFVIISGIATLWSLLQCVEDMMKMAETSLYIGIDLYFEHPKWKLRWDEVQISQQCCGVNYYKDWLSASWLSDTCDSDETKVYAPYSCCRQNCSACYKKYAPSTGNVPKLDISNINLSGCLPVFCSIFNNLINSLWFLLISASFSQLASWAFVRFVLSHQCSPLSNLNSSKLASILSNLGKLGKSDSCNCNCSKNENDDCCE